MEPATAPTATLGEPAAPIPEDSPAAQPEPAESIQPNRIKFTSNGLIAEAVSNQGGNQTQWRIIWGLQNLEDKTQSGHVFMEIDGYSSRPIAFKMRRYVEKELEIPNQNGKLKIGSRITGTVITKDADGSVLASEEFAITLTAPPSNKNNTTTSIKSGR
jgi:hypothetical protein